MSEAELSEAAVEEALRLGTSPLVLHFDVNQTVMVGDPAGAVSFEEGLNKAIAHACVVRRREGGGWAWRDGTPVVVDTEGDYGVEPPAVEESAEEAAAHAALRDATMAFEAVVGGDEDHFTEVFHGGPCRQFAAAPHGRPFRALFHRLRERLRWPADVPRHAHLTTADGFHFIVPAFFHTLCALRALGREFVCVFRTFGTDLPHVQQAMEAFARGEHYLFGEVGSAAAPAAWARLYPHWVLRRGDGTAAALTVERAGGAETEAAAEAGPRAFESEEQLEQFLNEDLRRSDTGTCCVAIQDDYLHWKKNNFLPSAGKTLWFTRRARGSGEGGGGGSSAEEDSAHHIFFDDNIHHKEDDSIVCVRARASPQHPFHSVSGAHLMHYHGSMLVKAFVMAAVLDRCYFLREIVKCERRFAELYHSLPI